MSPSGSSCVRAFSTVDSEDLTNSDDAMTVPQSRNEKARMSFVTNSTRTKQMRLER